MIPEINKTWRFNQSSSKDIVKKLFYTEDNLLESDRLFFVLKGEIYEEPYEKKYK
ncbi:hypothetical protein Desde_2720 [Desulfitobacterium dehalogenans ATCC 51507]|uniref:Uncharacterized protein n=1 Tax=Desulfitobacterium dehalogenans (strain ATCC 51507 / DSM 9161 / JW/IU-DC1) TaxID=756499 RepID=I4AAP8_DESDJ|nr:hypothetical protein Desde_2720 [Desulfitobacterium dehalogenans ATCC 51507]